MPTTSGNLTVDHEGDAVQVKWSLSGGKHPMLTVTVIGRGSKTTQLGGSSVEMLATMLAREILRAGPVG
jgi:hypothetical protein